MFWAQRFACGLGGDRETANGGVPATSQTAPRQRRPRPSFHLSRPRITSVFIAVALLAFVLAPAAASAATPTGFTGDAAQATDDASAQSITIGNQDIARTFTYEDGRVFTKQIVNGRAGTTLTPQQGSEEFTIRLTKTSGSATQPGVIDRSGWTATDDSHAKTGATEGPASNLIDGDLNSFWHTYYGNDENPNTDTTTQKQGFPYTVTFDLGSTQTVRAFSWTPRQHATGLQANGSVKGYRLYLSNAATKPATNADWGEPVSQGDLPADGVNTVYVNLDAAHQARWVRLVATSSQNGQPYAGGAEFNLYSQQVDEAPAGDDRDLSASDLILDGAPQIKSASATINGKTKSGKEIVFSFARKTFRGIQFTIREHIVMYDGDHYMRKFLEISVPEDQKGEAAIDYIDLESLKLTAEAQKTSWTVPTNAGGIVQMDRFKANLGQPIYVEGMFLGCEFPETDTEIVSGTGYMRYYSGKSFDQLVTDHQAGSTDDGKAITYNTWQTVAGAARSTDTSVVQQDFYSYIDDIATPSEFRSQYNSWFDNMMFIDDTSLTDSFLKVNKELEEAAAAPLDSYVADDGWNNYNSRAQIPLIEAEKIKRSGKSENSAGFWTFNDKFPNGFTPESALTAKLGSRFGVWVGPRGGYNYYSELAGILASAGTGSKAGDSIDVADRTYVQKFGDMATTWQDKYGVNYWKWDGFADTAQYNAFAATDGVPGYANRHMTGGYENMYHVTDLWEAWIDLFERVRANAAQNNIPNLWISLTCYVNPSPWFLQWANSVWLQCAADQADAGKSSSKLDRQLTYRDAAYHSFIKDHQFQFPLANVYNHDPIFGKEGTGMSADSASDVQFANYLYTQASRGTSFWELYFSPSLFTKGKWQVTAQFLKWAEENNHLLRNAKMFGASPAPQVTLESGGSTVEGGTYGFAGFDGSDGLITVRNPTTSRASISFTFDAATLGAPIENGAVYGYTLEHVYNPKSASALKDTPSDGGVKTDGSGTFTYGQQVSVSLEPDEAITFRVAKQGAGDKDAPRIASVATDGDRTLTVKFDEFVRGQKIEVAGQTVESVTPSADRVTYAVKLASAPKDGDLLTVSAGDDIKDLAGNKAADASASVTYRKGNLVASSSVKSYAAGRTRTLGSDGASLAGSNGFTVALDLVTTSKNAVIAAQPTGYTVGVDASGKPYITLNGVTATGDTAVSDGKGHAVTFVKANNGILKVYVDGSLSGSAYDAKNVGYAVTTGAATLGSSGFAGTLGATVYDRALAYDEVPKSATAGITVKNVALNKAVTAAKTDGTAAGGDANRPLSMAVDGVKNDVSNNYGEFGSDDYTEGSYLQVDLGAVYQLQGDGTGDPAGAIKMWRYWADGRTYKGTVIAVAEDEGEFAQHKATVVYNSDYENLFGFGSGNDATYTETAAGEGFAVPIGTKARYVRVYMHGSNKGNTNHINELEVYGTLVSAPADTSELRAAIDALQKKVDSGKYTDKTVEVAKAALTEARGVLAKDGATDADYAEQVEKLASADAQLKERGGSTEAETGSIEFLGASLRYSSNASQQIDGLRLGYTFRVPEGATVLWEQSGWNYGISANSLDSRFRNIDVYRKNTDGSYTANIVFTKIPVKNYGTNLYARAKLVYKDKEGGLHTVTRSVVDSRSVNGWASNVQASATATDAERQLAAEILAAGSK